MKEGPHAAGPRTRAILIRHQRDLPARCSSRGEI